MTTFPYPGDDPGALTSASVSFAANITSMGTLISGMTDAESNIKGAWQGDTAQIAAGDVSKINQALLVTVADFKTSQTAIDTLRSALVPIRSQVDDLRAQLKTATAELSSERQQYSLSGKLADANDMSDAELAKYRQGISADETETQGVIDSLTEQYNALVTRANTATAACATSLKSTISGQTYDPTISGLKNTTLEDMLGLTDLALLHRYQAGLDAKTAADDATKLLGLNPQTPEAIKLAQELAALLAKYPDGDPDFSVPFLKSIGQDHLLALSVYVAGLRGNDDSIGTTIATIQHDLGIDLAASTRLLGKPNPNGIQQLGQDWVDTLLADGGKGYRTQLNYVYDVKGFQALGILLRTGDYGSGFLTQSGDAMMDYEIKNGGPNTWLELGAGTDSNTRLWYGGGPDDERGLDPFNGWTAGMSDSSQAKQVLYDDVSKGGHGLVNFLLDHRDWSLRDSPGDSILGHYDGSELKVGLSDFGAMLDQKIGFGAGDPQSQAIFKSIITDLGSSDPANNGGRITANGGFGSNDWVPPELRRYLGDITARNIDTVHDTYTNIGYGDPKSDAFQNQLTRVIADLGKDPGANDRIYTAEEAWATHVMSQPYGYHSTDADALVRVSGLLTHGHLAVNTAVQQAADDAYNSHLDLIRTGVDAASSIVEVPGGPVAGATVDFLKGQFLDSVFAGLSQDHSGETLANNANYAASHNAQTVNAIGRAAYASIPDSVLGGLGPPYVDGQGHRVDLAHLDQNQLDDLRKLLESSDPNHKVEIADAFAAKSEATFKINETETYANDVGVR